MTEKKLIRLDQIIASLPGNSRKTAKALISSGEVTVDGVVVKNAALKVDVLTSEVRIGSLTVAYKKHIYIVQHKPQGVVSATKDRDDKTVLDILPNHLRYSDVFPAGRLDKYSEGLLIITNDGDFAHRILAPGKKVPKRYYVELDRASMTAELVSVFADGMHLGGEDYASSSELEILSPNSGYVTIYEGIYHQVRRMFDLNGAKVTRLVRVKMGGFELPSDLPMGESREMTTAELEAIFEK